MVFQRGVMATTKSEADEGRAGALRRMFIDHPSSLGMSWAGHGLGAVRIGFRLVGAGLACIVHAAIPGWFTETAGRTVTQMHADMARRKAGAANPENWPDYEI
jgi:hypothetical protein